MTVHVKHGRPEAPVRQDEYAANDPCHPHTLAMHHGNGCTGDADSEPLHDGDQGPPLTLADACDLLEDLGLATFKKGAR